MNRGCHTTGQRDPSKNVARCGRVVGAEAGLKPQVIRLGPTAEPAQQGHAKHVETYVGARRVTRQANHRLTVDLAEQERLARPYVDSMKVNATEFPNDTRGEVSV